MKIRNSIKKEIIAAAVGMLSPFVEDLTPTKLIAALEAFEGDNAKSAEHLEKPLTVAEACKLLSISKPTIYKMFRDGTLKKVKVRNSTRIPAAEIKRLLN